MDERQITEDEVYRFILHQIETVPHLEALLLLWRRRPEKFSEDQLAAQLFVDVPTVAEIVKDLMRRELVSGAPVGGYSYLSKNESIDALMGALAEIYRRDLIRVSTLIHSKAPSAIREFAKAFKFTKDRD